MDKTPILIGQHRTRPLLGDLCSWPDGLSEAASLARLPRLPGADASDPHGRPRLHRRGMNSGLGDWCPSLPLGGVHSREWVGSPASRIRPSRIAPAQPRQCARPRLLPLTKEKRMMMEHSGYACEWLTEQPTAQDIAPVVWHGIRGGTVRWRIRVSSAATSRTRPSRAPRSVIGSSQLPCFLAISSNIGKSTRPSTSTYARPARPITFLNSEIFIRSRLRCNECTPAPPASARGAETDISFPG